MHLTLDSGINVGVRLLIFGLFSSGYVLIKGGTFILESIVSKTLRDTTYELLIINLNFRLNIQTKKPIKFVKLEFFIRMRGRSSKKPCSLWFSKIANFTQ